MRSSRNLILIQFFIFVAVGLVSAATDLLCLWTLVTAGIAHLAAVSLAYGVGLLVNLGLHSRLTFQSQVSSGQVVRFLTLAAINYLLTVFVVTAFEWLSLSYIHGKLASLPAVAVSSFLLSKHWVYRARPSPQPGDETGHSSDRVGR